jgi:hypothetical protein
MISEYKSFLFFIFFLTQLCVLWFSNWFFVLSYPMNIFYWFKQNSSHNNSLTIMSMIKLYAYMSWILSIGNLCSWADILSLLLRNTQNSSHNNSLTIMSMIYRLPNNQECFQIYRLHKNIPNFLTLQSCLTTK